MRAMLVRMVIMRMVIVIMGVIMIMVCFIAIFGFRGCKRSCADLGRDELFRKVDIPLLVRHESYLHALHAPDMGTDAFSYGFFNLTRAADGPGAWHSQFDLNEVVLARFHTSNVSNLDFWIARTSGQHSGSCLPHGRFDFVIHSSIR